MKNKSILEEKYELLAKFCGFVYYPFNEKNQKFLGWYVGDVKKKHFFKFAKKAYICRKTVELNFEHDYNMIFKVVKIIESSGDFKVRIEKNYCSIICLNNNITFDNIIISSMSKIKSIFIACVNFVEWYNLNIKNK